MKSARGRSTGLRKIHKKKQFLYWSPDIVGAQGAVGKELLEEVIMEVVDKKKDQVVEEVVDDKEDKAKEGGDDCKIIRMKMQTCRMSNDLPR